jgi:hypothetical protein
MNKVTARFQVFLILFTVFVSGLYYFYWQPDDPYISIRYVFNFLNNGELFYNKLETTEGLVQGYSNSGFLIVYLVIMKMNLDVILILKILGIISFCSIALLVRKIVIDATRSNAAGFYAGILTSASSTFAWQSVSGLETIFLSNFLLLSFFLLKSGSKYKVFFSSILMGYSLTLRPEGIMTFLILTILIIINFKFKINFFMTQYKLLIAWYSGILLIFSMFISWLMFNYGSIFPNTSNAKLNGLNSTTLLEPSRFKYLHDFLFYNPALLILMLATIFLAFYESNRILVLVCTTMITPGIALAYLGQTDYFPNFRYLVPYIPFLYILIFVSVCSFCSKKRFNNVLKNNDIYTNVLSSNF